MGVRNLRYEEFKDQVEDLKEFAQGWRGKIYTGFWKGQKVAIKVAKRKEALKALQKEAEILEALKGYPHFPQIILKGYDFFVYPFIEGTPLGKAKLSSEEKAKVYEEILRVAYLLDELGIKKDEFKDLRKNVLIGKNLEVYLIDFERGGFSKRPTNLTQFLQVLRREGYLSMEEAKDLGKRYLKDREGVFKEVLAKLRRPP